MFHHRFVRLLFGDVSWVFPYDVYLPWLKIGWETLLYDIVPLINTVHRDSTNITDVEENE